MVFSYNTNTFLACKGHQIQRMCMSPPPPPSPNKQNNNNKHLKTTNHNNPAHLHHHRYNAIMLAAITTAGLYHCISLCHHHRYNAIMFAAITTAALYHCINLCHHCRYNAIMLAAITVTALYQSRSSPQVQRNHACSNNHSCTLSVCVITKCTRFEANHMELFYVIFLWLCITTCAMHCNA